MTEPIVERLLDSEEPPIRFKIRVRVLGESETSEGIRALQSEVGRSPRVRTLLANRDTKGRIIPAGSPYKKWSGAHWILATLADIGYPPMDQDLIPVVNQVLDYWLRPKYAEVPVIDGRARRCASQQGNALFSALSLGFVDERCHRLAEFLMRWQWPDGGWNCDRRPEAVHSSFWESLIPLRALSLYAKLTGSAEATNSVCRAVELFLKRRLFRRVRDGSIMNPQFTQLHYPCYWRYDILFGLKVMAEAGLVSDPRCQDALDLLEEKRLPDGGWPAEGRFYRASGSRAGGLDLVSWGGVNKRKMNEWITADALYVLKAAGRMA